MTDESLAALPDAAPERRRGSGVRLVYETLRDEILDLVLRPGSALDEVALAERFGMSRTPIREALVRLAGEGLVDTLPNRSTIVAPIDYLNLHHFFDAITLMYRVSNRQAARYHTPADLARIRAAQADYAAAVNAQDALAMIAANRAFHAAIAEAGGNPYYTQFFVRMLDEGRRLLRLYYQSFDDRLPQEYVEEHEAIIAAIASGDVGAADRLGRAHADQIVAHIQALLARDDRDDPAL
ncbi:GntR family transcriptional regulator [Paracoccus sanguinis]|uniref:Transcriptional regulator, GntR family n=1 Tax=Paracoccus sanguinis TaxID=1545044 RepID=A0A1H2WYY1_9RHOB|nr:GntR family transcriptional regulator [Paracoccus sanguinis]KGJ17430.1 AsnC family transcriptional regulator [Paracoccus sanguinis]SDW85757.1 transcriptional regulator, GntR family [Paracoccus sanguinis]